MASSPLIIVPTTTSVAAVLVPVKARPGNDGACGQGRATADLDRPCARRPQHVWVGAKKRDSKSNKETGMKEVESGVKYMLDFKSPIQGLLGVHSRCGLHTRTVTKSRPLSRGFRHFVISMPAPVASGWSGCRVGLAPTGTRRLARRTGHATISNCYSRLRPDCRRVPRSLSWMRVRRSRKAAVERR